MKLTVVWLPAAEEELTELWLAAADKRSFAHDANEIERELRRHPYETGDSQFDAYETATHPPLVVFYKVSPDDMLVQIVRVALLQTDN